MKTIGIIAEYNPFHNGHAWQIAEAKKRTGADCVVVVMSGDFVQRGAPAVTDKFTRAHMALLGGADLIIELPVSFACAGTEYFARGACTLLHRLNVVDVLCFGCEDEEPEAFEALAAFFAAEPAPYRERLRASLAAGASFPRARMTALTSCLAEHAPALSAGSAQALLSSPNNVLGLEYMTVCRREGYAFTFLPLRRQGTGHHDAAPSGRFASASLLRRDLSLADRCIPPDSLRVFRERINAAGARKTEDYDELLHYALLLEEDYASFLDVSQDLADRIKDCLPQYRSFAQFVTLLKTKQMTEARIRRCLLHILLGIKKEPFKKDRFPGLSYARILGFTGRAQPLLHEIRQRRGIPLIAQAAEGKKRLDPDALSFFSLNLRSSSVYHIPEEGGVYNEYQIPVLKV